MRMVATVHHIIYLLQLCISLLKQPSNQNDKAVGVDIGITQCDYPER